MFCIKSRFANPGEAIASGAAVTAAATRHGNIGHADVVAAIRNADALARVETEYDGFSGPLAPESLSSRDRWDGRPQMDLSVVQKPVLIGEPRKYSSS